MTSWRIRFAAAELPAWENDEAFEQLLLSFESILPLRRPSDFRDPKVRQRILTLTQGVLGRVCRLMETAAVEAIRSGEERITLALLKEELVTESLVSIADRQHAGSRDELMVAPAKLPFAPRPYSAELLSSWLLRVAAANLVSLRELLNGFESRYGRVLTNDPIDYGIPDEAVTALAQFCRIPPAKIRALDLRERAPHLDPALLLRFHRISLFWCPRCSLRRVRYAFCPLCLARQQVIYVGWNWSVACLIRCAVHGAPLLDGCSACGEPEPLTFSGFDSPPTPVC